MWHHHGSDTPTSARAILHHTDQKGPNILHPSRLVASKNEEITITIYSHVQKSIENWSVWSKIALGEVGVSLP